MKKVYVTKQDSPAAVISKVLKARDEEVILYIPRGTKFADSRNGFVLLKRETRAAQKTVLIESVDDDVLELASTAGFKAANPFLGRKRKAVSDIVVVRPAAEAGDEEGVNLEEIGKDAEVEEVEVKVEDKEEKEVKESVEATPSDGAPDASVEAFMEKKKKKLPKFKKGRARRKDKKERIEKSEKIGPAFEKIKKPHSFLKKALIAIGVTAVLSGITVVVIVILPRVNLLLNLEKTDWDYVGSINVSASIKENQFTNEEVKIRGISFTEQRNVTNSYPATGREFVERKAKGTMIVYNAYSSDEQILVKTTRFVSPEGKLYRTDEDVTVPGAKIVEGEIIPSSTEVGVTADKAGDEFNIGPVPKFRIPGFQESPKYDGFYGESSQPMSGGFVGERNVPTEGDIEAAREDIKNTLEELSKTQLFLNLPEEVKFFDDTYRFELIEESIDDGAEDSETFSVTAVGEADLVGFRESELVDTFGERVMQDTESQLVVKEYQIEYGNAQPNSADDGFTIPIDFKSTWTMPFDTAEFKNSASGKSETELKTLIFSIPGVQSGEVRFWPFWVKTVPEKLNRIIVDVE